MDKKFKKGTQKEVAELFRVNRSTVCRAISFELNSDLAVKIRTLYASVINKKATELHSQNNRPSS